MKYYSKIHLPFYEKVKQYGINFTKRYIDDNSFKFKLAIHQISDPLVDLDREWLELSAEIENYFTDLGLSKTWSPVFFIRNIDTCDDIKTIHVDSISEEELHKCTIVIPIRGYTETYHYWYSKNYTVKEFIVYPKGYKSHILEWNGEPKIIDKIELTDTPFLSRADVPHTGSCGSEQRVTLTIRFKTNYSFEYLTEILNKNIEKL